jgi:hypothetical protein
MVKKNFHHVSVNKYYITHNIFACLDLNPTSHYVQVQTTYSQNYGVALCNDNSVTWSVMNITVQTAWL